MKHLALFLVTIAVAATSCSSAILPLQRAQSHQRGDMETGVARDRARNAYFLGKFPVGGNGVFDVSGLYYTRVKLGSPPKEFTVSIDTGSDLLWVSCKSCVSCPQHSGLGIHLNSFDVANSTTATLASCSNLPCVFNISYDDGSQTSGYGVTDMITLPSTLTASADLSVRVKFGCSTTRYGLIANADYAVDGMFGFGRGSSSVISQLHAQGITPHVFSHCLKGDVLGGGFLVLGEVVLPGMQYSPIIPSQAHYNLDLQIITIDGQILPTSSMRVGISIDSGTTFTYLPQDTYDSFIEAINSSVYKFAQLRMEGGPMCYMPTTSKNIPFPSPILTFSGGATMTLRPQDYLVSKTFPDGSSHMCLGIQVAVDGGECILGEISLNDKVIVYDLHQNRIGWADYDCWSSYNLSMSYGFGTGESAGKEEISWVLLSLHICILIILW